MQHLYSAAVVRPLSASGTVANRLGYGLLSWSDVDDLVAVISGDGAVHIFHADAPGETTMLLAYKRAPARHVAWRPRRDKPPLLLVADAASRLTIWVSKVCLGGGEVGTGWRGQANWWVWATRSGGGGGAVRVDGWADG